MVGNSNMDQCHNYACQNNQCVTTAKDPGTLCNADGNVDTCGTCQNTAFGFACLEEANSCATSENVTCGKEDGHPCYERDTNKMYCFDDQSIMAKLQEGSVSDPFAQITPVQTSGIFPGLEPICTSAGCGGLSRTCCYHATRHSSPTVFCHGGLHCSNDLICTTTTAANLSPYDQSCTWKTAEGQTTHLEGNTGFNQKVTLKADCPDPREFFEDINYIYVEPQPTDNMPIPAITNTWYKPDSRDVERRETTETN
jgi:hypothetical protein